MVGKYNLQNLLYVHLWVEGRVLAVIAKTYMSLSHVSAQAHDPQPAADPEPASKIFYTAHRLSQRVKEVHCFFVLHVQGLVSLIPFQPQQPYPEEHLQGGLNLNDWLHLCALDQPWAGTSEYVESLECLVFAFFSWRFCATE